MAGEPAAPRYAAMMLVDDRVEQQLIGAEREVFGGEVQTRLGRRHLDERAKERPLPVQAAQPPEIGAGNRCPAAVLRGQKAAVLRPREDPGNGAK
jgi:hypothetical protein